MLVIKKKSEMNEHWEELFQVTLTHSNLYIPSTLAWKIPWAEGPGRLQSMGSRRVGHTWATSLSVFTFMHRRRKWQPTRVLAWSIPGTGETGGLPSMGSHRVGHDWSDLAAAEAAAVFSLRTKEYQKILNCIVQWYFKLIICWKIEKINNCANVFRNICKTKRNAKSVKLTKSHVMTLCFHWNISTVYFYLANITKFNSLFHTFVYWKGLQIWQPSINKQL